MTRPTTMTLAGVLAVLALNPANAQSVEQFYKGKTLNFIIGAGAGGSYDLYARTLTNTLPKYIPGNPVMIVKIAGGVGGGVATSVQMEHSVPKDGTYMGMTQQTNVTSQLTEAAVAGKYDVSKWRWVGNMANLRNMLAVWMTAPAQTLEEAKTKEVIVGATGRNSPTFIVPQALNVLLGTKYKIVLGYNGASDLNLAMERGEIQARGASWISVVTQAPQYISEKKIKPLVVDGLTRDPLLPDVPTLLELAPSEEQKAAIRLISAANEFSRAAFLPPGTPEDRVQALRQAFDATMKDEGFLAEARRLQLPIEPTDGASLDKLAGQVVASSPAAIKLAKQLLGE
ncbi:tripartite tricarboxylate transporter substrate-binding protein [Roseiarcaceae bacterium H3SJ34-1]|uniref:Bug family tripartite tricarboxylate transporter substrate binding protein n=1 Tax=Terripilifer ovatus TaxID=3032367 RepID=UPI003AB98E49|nr:tripartite tricarboxylate transporter substrate-binding protein [Roseiarcaceae bacterium H3SJ34-1]